MGTWDDCGMSKTHLWACNYKYDLVDSLAEISDNGPLDVVRKDDIGNG